MVMIMKNLVKGKKVAPLYNHVVVRDLNDSSRYFPVKNEAGIIRANGSSFDDGIEEYNVASSIMGIGEVIAVGPEVKMVKPGDEVMYDIRSMLPMPIKFDEDKELMPRVRHISEQNIKCIFIDE